MYFFSEPRTNNHNEQSISSEPGTEVFALVQVYHELDHGLSAPHLPQGGLHTELLIAASQIARYERCIYIAHLSIMTTTSVTFGRLAELDVYVLRFRLGQGLGTMFQQ